MGPSRFAVVLGAALLAVSPLRAEVAELDEIALLNAEAQIAICARYDQFFAAYDLAFLVPELRATVLGRIDEQGASAAQRDRLARLYDATLAESEASGLEPGSRKAELTRARLAVLEAEADRVRAFCDRWLFTLAQVGPPPEQAGVGGSAMFALRYFVEGCGVSSVLSSKSGFDEFYPDFRKVTLENARRHGTSETQFKELARLFDEGVARGKERPFDRDKEAKMQAEDQDYYQYRKDAAGSVYSHCAAKTFDMD